MKLGTDLPAYETQLKKNYLTERQVNDNWTEAW